MEKKVIQIDSEKCVGCGLCANTCHQSAIEIIDGKAKVVRDNFCDGLGRCLPVCPVSAISFADLSVKKEEKEKEVVTFQCPSAQMKTIQRKIEVEDNQEDNKQHIPSKLNQWPVQIKLVPVTAPYFHHGHLLVAADCSAFSYANFHEEFMKNKITIIGCPKLDDVDYAEKLTKIITENEIQSLTVVCMEVPCCGGIENAVITGLKNSGKMIPWKVVTLSIDGKIL